MPDMTELAHQVLRGSIAPGALVVDATVGNGHDTLFLAGCVGPTGRVFGFDIQEQALAATAARVRGLSQVTLFHNGHEELGQRLPADAKARLAAVMFNLGYLPGAAKDLATQMQTTLAALDQALDLLCVGGLVTMVLYSGHPGGREEADAVRSMAKGLPATFTATLSERINSVSAAPELLIIERLR